MKKQIILLMMAATLTSCCLIPNKSRTISHDSITTPQEALAELKAGNQRFVKGKMISPNQSAQRREQTENSQKPFAVVVACSDSRVPVEMIFDQGIGDIFVIRTAGNSVADDVVMGSIDYAVDHLHTPLVVILGHQNCGGITSAITACSPDEEHHHGKIDQLLAVLVQDVEKYVGHPEELDEAIHANAEAQVHRIEKVAYIKEKLTSGELQIVSAYYNLKSGEVSFDEVTLN